MWRSNSRKLKKVILACLVNIFIIVIGLLSNTIGTDLRMWLDENKINPPAIYILILACALLTIFILTWEKWSEHKEDEGIKLTTKNIEPDVKRFFDSLKERYQKRYKSKLDGRFEISLEVSEDWNSDKPKTYKFGTKAKITNAVEAVRKAFNEKGRLLIVGSSGSGKTVLLLKLALELLGREYKADHRLPVILNLASWSEDYEKFEDWLIDILNANNGLSKDFAGTLLQEKRIIFLLDGLDELDRNEDSETANRKRAKCLNLLNNYLREGREAVICCRRDVFVEMQKTTNQDAPVSAKVEVLDLTKADILLALQDAQNNNESRTAAKHLEEFIETTDGYNNVFLEVLSTPFYFTTALEVFDKPLQKTNIYPIDSEEIKIRLLDEFIESKIYQTRNLAEFEKDTAKIKKWLKWLATLMENKQSVTFELADLQPSDVAKKWVYTFIVSIFISFWFSLILGLMVGFGSGLYYGLISSLISFLFILFYVNLAAHFNFTKLGDAIQTKYKTHDVIVINPYRVFHRKFWKLWAMTIFMGVGTGISYGSTSGLVVFLVFLQFFLLNISKEAKNFIYIKEPYQRFYGNIKIDLMTCLFSLIVSTMILYFSIAIGVPKITIGLIVGCGLFLPLLRLFMIPFTEHILVRLALYLEGLIPLKYMTFLSYVAEAKILEEDGGFWRFRHQYLQKYFVNLSGENNWTK